MRFTAFSEQRPNHLRTFHSKYEEDVHADVSATFSGVSLSMIPALLHR